MKRIYLISMLLFVIVTVFAIAQDQPAFKKYDMISGYVEYKVSDYCSGTQELYFEEYGKYSSRSTNIKCNNVQMDHSIMIETPEANYFINLNSAKGSKSLATDYSKTIEKFTAEGGNFEKVQEILMREDGYKKIGVEKILDRECIMWEASIDNVKIIKWMWKGINLKNTSENKGTKLTQEAIKILEEEPIPFSKFEPPSGIVWEEKK